MPRGELERELPSHRVPDEDHGVQRQGVPQLPEEVDEIRQVIGGVGLVGKAVAGQIHGHTPGARGQEPEQRPEVFGRAAPALHHEEDGSAGCLAGIEIVDRHPAHLDPPGKRISGSRKRDKNEGCRKQGAHPLSIYPNPCML